MEQFFIIAASEGFKRRVHLGKQRFFLRSCPHEWV